MSNKIAIILKSESNNKYSFNGISNIYSEENQIKISNKNFNKLVKGEEIELLESQITPGKDIFLIFDEDELIKQASKEGLSDEEAKASARNALSTIGNNIENVVLESLGEMAELKISFTKEKKKQFNINEINPEEIIKKIKEAVIAQDSTVENVVYAISNNQVTISTGNDDMISTQKDNIILDGPTGTGKSFIMHEVAAKMSLPILITPATMYTTTGYRGVELKEMLIKLLEETDGDLELAERGIIVLDEFDKLGNDKDAKNSLEIRKAVQQDLLTFIGGSKYTVEYKGKNYEFDTSKITFVCLGAFTEYREKQTKNLDETGNYKLNTDDYINAGIMRELVGRLNLHFSTNSLGKEDLKKIVTDSSKSHLKSLIEFAKDNFNTNLIFDESIIDDIVDIAYKTNTGARALKSMFGQIKSLISKDLWNNPKDLYIPKEIIEIVKRDHQKGGLTK